MQGNMLNNTNDPAERMRIMREVCESECINTILPPCAPLDQALADILNEAMQSNVIDINQLMCHDYYNIIMVLMLACLQFINACMHACTIGSFYETHKFRTADRAYLSPLVPGVYC